MSGLIRRSERTPTQSRARRPWLLILCQVAGVACGGPVEGDFPAGQTVSLATIPTRVRPVAIDTAYGDHLVYASACIAVAHSNGTNNPDVEFYALDGKRVAVWQAQGAGPGEVGSIDAISSWQDSIVVYDRANARLMVLDCTGHPIRSVRVPFNGMQVVASGDNYFAMGDDAVAPIYGVWIVGGVVQDTIPRIGPRLRAAQDYMMPHGSGGLAILDGSAGALALYRRGESIPYRIDTLPERLTAPQREAFQYSWADYPKMLEVKPYPLVMSWTAMPNDTTLAIGYIPFPSAKGVAFALWHLGSTEFVQIPQPQDSLLQSALQDQDRTILRGDTVISLTRDTLFRFLLDR